MNSPITHCPRCNETPIIEMDGLRTYIVLCDNCYDGAPDSCTRGEYSIGDTEEEAITDWNLTAGDLLESMKSNLSN